MNPSPPRRTRASPVRVLLTAVALSGLLASPGRGYTHIRIQSFSVPPAFWPVGNLPLPMRINSAGSDDAPGTPSINAIIAGQQTWSGINTDYFSFAAPTVAGGTSLNATDGINSIFFDETGANFGAGSSAIAFTALNIDAGTGVISDADLLFNGTFAFSVATPTPQNTDPPTFDIQTIAAHELGHVTGLDHAGLISSAMFPVGADGAQFGRNLASDDRLADSFLYPETAGGAGIAGLQAGDADLNQTTGTIAGFVRTSGGVAVPGAQVVALDANGSAVVSDVSHPDGGYLLTGLYPGMYQVYAEPLDGVTIEQDLSQGAFMNAFAGFVTTFLGGNGSPTVVTVAAGGTSSGNVINLGDLYGVETEPNNVFTSATPAALETLTSGIVNPAADIDYFSFSGTSGDFISIDVDSSGDGCPLDPVITLYTTNGTTQIATNDDFDLKGNDSRIALRLPATGTFYLKVVDFPTVHPFCPNDGPGSFYTAHVNKAIPEAESNNTFGTANAAAIGQYRGGIISTSSDVDWYSFTAGFGDRILADVTARRAGSALDPILTLFSSNGTTQLAINNDISSNPVDRDSFIDFTFTNQTPATFYLRVSAQSGAGSSSFYILHIGTDGLNLAFSAVNSLGLGVGGSWVADIFPKFVPQGANFDLIVAGIGIPSDPAQTISVSGPGVSLTSSAGPDFGVNLQGFDFLAMSTFVSGSAPPGHRTIFTQNATLKAALSAGLVITPVGLPPEAAQDPSPILWSGEQMVWGADPSASFYNLYRGSLTGLVDADQNGVADNYGSAFACRLTSPQAADPAAPVLGDGFFYLVTEVNVNGQGTLGFTRSNSGPGPERPLTALTSVCP